MGRWVNGWDLVGKVTDVGGFRALQIAPERPTKVMRSTTLRPNAEPLVHRLEEHDRAPAVPLKME